MTTSFRPYFFLLSWASHWINLQWISQFYFFSVPILRRCLFRDEIYGTFEPFCVFLFYYLFFPFLNSMRSYEQGRDDNWFVTQKRIAQHCWRKKWKRARMILKMFPIKIFFFEFQREILIGVQLQCIEFKLKVWIIVGLNVCVVASIVGVNKRNSRRNHAVDNLWIWDRNSRQSPARRCLLSLI